MPVWLRRYGAALVLTASVLNAPPEGRARAGAPLVRLVGRTPGGFDPREQVAPGVVLAVPLEPDEGPATEAWADPCPN